MTAIPWDYRPRNSSVMKRFMKRSIVPLCTVDTFVEIKRKVHLLIRLAYPSINIFPVGEVLNVSPGVPNEL